MPASQTSPRRWRAWPLCLALAAACTGLALAQPFDFFHVGSFQRMQHTGNTAGQAALGAALVFGIALSVASTVVLLKALESHGVLDSMNGRIAVGWLVVEDLATVLVLVMLPPLAGILGGNAGAGAGDGPIWMTIAKTLLEVGAFIALMLIVGRKVIPWLL